MPAVAHLSHCGIAASCIGSVFCSTLKASEHIQQKLKKPPDISHYIVIKARLLRSFGLQRLQAQRHVLK